MKNFYMDGKVQYAKKGGKLSKRREVGMEKRHTGRFWERELDDIWLSVHHAIYLLTSLLYYNVSVSMTISVRV